MYPIFRMAKEKAAYRNAQPLPLLGVHRSSHVCWPWDLDPWIELNNGRTLTLFDLGRIPLFSRIGIKATLRQAGWRMTVAGVTVRYRHRIQVFHKVAMQSRVLGWDGRFIYVEQSLWNQKGECTTQAIYRMAVTGGRGIIPPEAVIAEMGTAAPAFTLPNWVQAWIAAENQRPWPPERL